MAKGLEDSQWWHDLAGLAMGTFLILIPENESIIPYSTGEVQTIEEGNSTNWQPGDPIIEPQGVYRLSNGKLILSRECSRS